MREQMPDPDRLGRRDGHGAQRRTLLEDPHTIECRDEAADRIAQVERALLVQHHRRDRGDRLGHRVDAEERVRLHRQSRLDVAVTTR